MAMKVFNIGDVLAAADVNEYLTHTKFASKPASTSRTSNNTLSNDPDLSLSVDASKTYRVEMYLVYHADTTGAMQIQFSAPTGANFYGWVLLEATGGSTAIQTTASFAIGAICGLPAQSGGITYACMVTGNLVTSGTAGSLTLQWAQNVSSATSTVLQQGSWLFLRRVA